MTVTFGPAGLGSTEQALQVLEGYFSLGFRACEISFTRGVYIKEEQCPPIKKKAEELGIILSIHAPYFVNLNSEEPEKREASKKRIIECCRIGEMLGAKLVVFHPGYYGKLHDEAYSNIKKGILDIMEIIKEKGWKIRVAPETTGRINVFGSIEEISALAQQTGCSFCIDFAHILARYKKIEHEKIEIAFPQKEWHCHFSGISYGEKGEKRHVPTQKKEWEELLKSLPKNRDIRIINESPVMIGDSIEGLKVYNKIK